MNEKRRFTQWKNTKTPLVDSIPKGLIIEATDETENSYIINPIYGFGYYVFLPKQICKKVC